MSLEKIRRHLREDGLYLLGRRLLGHSLSAAHSALIARRLGVRQLKLGPRAYLRGLSCIRMGEDFAAGEGLWLEAITRFNDQEFSPRIVIGNHVRISHGVHIAATHLVEIGDHVLMGSRVLVIDHNHGKYSVEHTPPSLPPTLRPLDNDKKTVIGARVWLGDGVVVMPGACIGEGSVIGANSVVRGTIPPLSIAAGAPAKVLKIFDTQTQRWIGAK